MDKHAYLIMAHDNFDNLEKLISILDDKRNDIYIHIDKKVKDIDFNKISDAAKISKVSFIDRISVSWGGYSQIQCEMSLLEESVKTGYKYYHLLSGADLPIKSQDYIHNFFHTNDGFEFVDFANDTFNRSIKFRYANYHFLQEYFGRKRNLLYFFEKVSILVQKVLKIDRTKKTSLTFCGGSQWFSITNDLAKYLIDQEKIIEKSFRFTRCCDEVFLQTMVYNSKFFNKVYGNEFTNEGNYTSLRYIDWKRGNPYTFQESDFEELTNARYDYLFARKTDPNGALLNKFKESFLY